MTTGEVQPSPQTVADIINRATDGEVNPTILAKCAGSLSDAGVSSLDALSVADELEKTFDVEIDTDAYSTVLATVDSIIEFVLSQRNASDST